VSARRLPRPNTQTPLQRNIAAVGDLFLTARRELGRREYEVFLSVLAARVASETAARLDLQERPR
jgi:hypothetical protein